MHRIPGDLKLFVLVGAISVLIVGYAHAATFIDNRAGFCWVRFFSVNSRY